MEAIVNNLIKAIGWSIFHSLWQGAIIYGILILSVAIVPKLNAKVKHNLAYSAMCLMFIGFCITFFSIFRVPQAQINSGVLTNQFSSNEPADYLISLTGELNNRTEHLFPYLVSVYGIGLVFQLLILSVGYKKLLKLKHAERNSVPPEWAAVFDQLLSKLNLRRRVSFYLSANVNVPLVIGYFKPVVLFPIALAAQLDIQQVEAILIHELSHIRRNDYLLNLIKTGIETVLFFNPFIWLSARFINIEREHACDDLVLKFTGTPVTYAHALLKLEILKNKSTPVLSMAATGGNQHLYQRIKRITDMKTNYMNAKQQLFAITLTVATVISLAWVNPSKTTSPVADKLKVAKTVRTENQNTKFRVTPITEAKTALMNCDNLQDTSKKKKFKIVTVDAKGVKKEYNSVKEMPDSLRQEVISETFMDDFHFDFRLDSTINATMSYIKSPEFKQTMKDAQLHASVMIKKMSSPEFKKQQEKMQKEALMMAKQFQSEDFKKSQRDIQKVTENMQKHFNSPEFKKQKEEVKKLHESKEYKELREKFDKDIQKLKEQKGIKSDLKAIHISPDKGIVTSSGKDMVISPDSGIMFDESEVTDVMVKD